MKLEYRKLSDDELAQGLERLNGWAVVDGKLSRSFEFPEYMKGADFVARVASTAQEMDHHPDIFLGYKKATVSVSTHSVDGLSPYDLELASRIDRLT
jgi:4a-hydroxytetrahydrobiopterin dehydratase